MSPQAVAQLRSEFDRLIRLASRRIWVPPTSGPCIVRLTSMDSGNNVPFEPLIEFLHSFKEATGFDLTLSGGGYGCFDLAFTGAITTDIVDSGDAIEAAITGNAEIQDALNRLGMHLVRVETLSTTRTFRAYSDLEIAIATNRDYCEITSLSEDGVRDVFGTGLSAGNTYGLADVSISDMSKKQPKKNMLKRAWRVAMSTIGIARKPQVIVRNLDVYSETGFSDVLKSRIQNGAVVFVHGYANTFDDAIEACTVAAHRSRLTDLALLPVVFSWPAAGGVANYLGDTKVAENSEFHLLQALDLVGNASGAVLPSVLGHSHGNKLVIRALTTQMKGRRAKANWLNNLVLVEPDVDQVFLEQRTAILTDAANKVVIYHSANDRALKLASVAFGSVRAGQEGIFSEELGLAPTEGLEVIDVTDVATGWTRHAPHIESIEVLADLYHLFLGHPPEARPGLRRISPSHWAIKLRTLDSTSGS